MDNRPIGIFDSGIGGMTVLKELREELPNENFIYFGDTKNFPYGNKTKEQIVNYSSFIVDYLIKKNVKMIIIACGTATSQALKELKEMYEIYIEGIIEPTTQYVQGLNLDKIGVIGTIGTIRSGAWENALRDKISNIKIINEACPLLAEIVEEGKATLPESIEVIHNYMEIFKNEKIDTIILGCTHYPVFDEIIEKDFDYKINLINTGKIIAKKTKRYLQENDKMNHQTTGKTKIIISKKEENFEERAKNILKSNKTLDITELY